MEFKDIVIYRRSIRKFTNDDVPHQALMNILEAGRWAPSAGNSQPWHFIVVTNPQTKAAIAENCTRFSKEHWAQFPPERAKYLAARGGTWNKTYMKDIPVLMAVSYKYLKNIMDELVLGSVWMAVENMLLAATDEGLGSCLYTFLNREEEDELKKILHANQEDRIACLIQLGYAKVKPICPLRKQISEIVTYDFANAPSV